VGVKGGAGTTTVVLNLAAALARQGTSTIVV
jgi:cellulose biosynthesis protein BcsQ